jgi:hypothetical protein
VQADVPSFTEVVNDTVRKPDAVEFMVKAWGEVDENVMRRPWGIDKEPYDDAEPTHEDIFMDHADEDWMDEDQHLLNIFIAFLHADRDE